MGHVVAVAVGLVPLAVLGWDVVHGNLSANPIEDVTHRTGDWTLYLLLATLAVSPLRRLTGRGGLVRYRRTLGLLAFGYACLHFLTYAILDQGLFLQGDVLSYLGEDVMKRPYITVGFTAFVLLVPLAVTSTKGWVRRLGGRRWSALHRLVYVAGALGVLHYLWLVKGEQTRPVYFALALVGLLAARVVRRRITARRPTPGRAPLPAPVRSPP